MNKILIPTNPNESIILPPYVDFRSAHQVIRYEDDLTERELDEIATIAIKQSKQEGQE